MFTCRKVNEYVYYSADTLNLRTIPTVTSESYGYVYYGAQLHRIGRSKCGWDIIEIDDIAFFVWNEYLSEEPLEIFVPEEEEEDWAATSYEEYWEPDYEITEPEPPQTIYTYVGEWAITFYCKCEQCCGVWSQYPGCASGVIPTPWYTCACGPSVPFGTTFYVEGLGYFVCEDRGVPDGWMDIFVNNHDEIPAWGLANVSTYIVN